MSVTFVSALFDIGRDHDDPLYDFKEYRSRTEKFLEIPVKIVLFVSPGISFPERDNLIVRTCHKLPFTDQRVKDCWSGYRTNNPKKDTPEFAQLTVSKFFWLEEVIQDNPFQTTHFAWIDSAVVKVAPEIHLLPSLMPPDKVRFMIMNYISEREVSSPSFVLTPRTKIAGGLVTGRGDNLIRLIGNLKNEIEEALTQRRFGLEQEFLAILYRKFYQDFDPYYGYFPSLIINYAKPVKYLDLIRGIVRDALIHHDDLEADRAAKYFLFRDNPIISWCERFLNPESTLIEVGSITGQLIKRCNVVHAFDCRDISVDNVVFHHTALGSEPGKAILYKNGDKSTLSAYYFKRLSSNVPEQVEVNVATLDSFEIKNVDLITIDVMGWELAVLKGAEETLKQTPAIILNVWPYEWYRPEKEKVLDYLQDLGYHVSIIPGTSSCYLAEKGLHSTWEELYLSAKYHRENRYNKIAYLNAKRALEITPPDKIYYPLEEISISAYYLGSKELKDSNDLKEEGFLACERIVLSHAPWEKRNFTILNQGYYMSPLVIKKRIPFRHDKIPPDYISSSMSIVPFESGYRAILRSVNYSITDQGCYTSRDSDGLIRTRNFLLYLNEDFSVECSKELINVSGTSLYPSRVIGLEDVRIFGSNYFFTVCRETNPNDIPQINFGVFNDAGLVERLIPLQVTPKIQCEKNWLLFMNDDKINFIYSFDPLRIFELDPEAGTINETVNRKISDLNLESFRGSGSPVSYRGGWLCTIHQVHYANNRKYFHRFVWLDKDFTQIKFSRPFIFERPNIEYSIGLCHSPDGLIVTHSYRDNTTNINIVDYSVVDAFL